MDVIIYLLIWFIYKEESVSDQTLIKVRFSCIIFEEGYWQCSQGIYFSSRSMYFSSDKNILEIYEYLKKIKDIPGVSK